MLGRNHLKVVNNSDMGGVFKVTVCLKWLATKACNMSGFNYRSPNPYINLKLNIEQL